MRFLCVLAAKMVPVFCLGKMSLALTFYPLPQERKSPVTRLDFPVAGRADLRLGAYLLRSESLTGMIPCFRV
jgi:hypothetical protein